MPGENSDNIFKILIATDNHLGYNEKDHERGDDSFITFKEILELAQKHQVDFILLGGDLFHDNKPSRKSMVKCMEDIKNHCFGDKPIEFQYVSDPATNFPHLKEPCVNFHDHNLNVSIPIFSIHGNHDDPSGPGQFCALDMLSATGLVNYFGRASDLNHIKVSPILLEKGTAKLALYGLSAIKDERLFRLFLGGEVEMLRPKEDTDEWFNLFVLHQNHVARPPTNYIPEEFLSKFLNLVIWGHEHESLVEPRVSSQGFYVIQPGSSVATSLCEGESKQKNVVLLQVDDQRQMKIDPLPLQTVRPFVFRNVVLSECDINFQPILKINKKEEDSKYDSPRAAAVARHIEGVVREMIEESKHQLTGHPKQPTKPLLRLRIEYSEENEMFNINRFGHKFEDSVANYGEMILFRKLRKQVKKEDGSVIDEEVMDAIFEGESLQCKVEDKVKEYFSQLELDDKKQLKLLTERGLSTAVSDFVDKDDTHAIADTFKYQVDKMVKHLSQIEDITEQTVGYHILQFKQERALRNRDAELDLIEAREALSDSNRPSVRPQKDTSISDSSNSDSDSSAPPPPTRGRGRGRGRGAARGGRGRGKAPALDFSSSRSSTASSKPIAKVDSMFARQRQRMTPSQSSKKGVMFDSDSD